jgi:predicted ATP-grasp superfamily ATP-dependent carboligase
VATGETNLLIFGASARAAAFSALRAGLRPWCLDLFADADLQAVCPVMRLPGTYPEGFLDWIGTELPGPWMYTGGLENRPWFVERMAVRRPLWGNDCAALLKARNPGVVGGALRAAGLPTPGVEWYFRQQPKDGRWLVKPTWGGGAGGIHFWTPADAADAPSLLVYLQEFIEGESRSAVYCGEGKRATLLGATRQLVGVDWLHAEPFRYCGSVGPLAPPPAERVELEKIGGAIAARCGLRGLFGVDGIWRDGHFFPVEVNPRYPASIEVLEYATGLAALAWHRRAFDASGPRPAAPSEPRATIGKAVLFAPKDATFPAAGPWSDSLRAPSPAARPAFADIPPPQSEIKSGRPVLTFFAAGVGVDECMAELRRTADELTERLFGGEATQKS